MALKLVRSLGNPRQFTAKTGSRPTISVRGLKKAVVLRSVTLRGRPLPTQSARSVTLDIAPGINTLRLLVDPFDPQDTIELVEENCGESQVLHTHRFDRRDPVSGYRIFGE